jgi:hypothetical protein
VLRALLPRAKPAPGAISPVPLGDLPAEAEDTGGSGVVRDRERVLARYARDPAPYEGVAEGGAAVLLVSGGKGFVVDQWGGADVAGPALRRLIDLGAHVVHYWRGPGEDDFSRALRAAGLKVVRKRKAVLARVLDDGLAPLPAPDRWTFRMGDTDGI